MKEILFLNKHLQEEWNQGFQQHEELFPFLNSMRNATPEEIEKIDRNIKKYSVPTGINFWDYLNEGENNMKEIKIKYFTDKIERLKYIGGSKRSNWIDLRAAETMELKANNFYLIPLGVAMKLPEGYEAHIAPRSSTFKTWGIIQVNSVGVVDESYCGDTDQWLMPVYATRDTTINVNDRVCQFRIMKNQPTIEFTEVKQMENESRGGIGSTGKQ